jgi:hypothetical protein
MTNLNPREYIVNDAKFDEWNIDGIQRLQMSTALNGLTLEMSTGMKLTAKANVLEVLRRYFFSLPRTKKRAFRILVQNGFYKKRV